MFDMQVPLSHITNGHELFGKSLCQASTTCVAFLMNHYRRNGSECTIATVTEDVGGTMDFLVLGPVSKCLREHDGMASLPHAGCEGCSTPCDR